MYMGKLKIDKSGYLKVLIEGKSRLYMAVCGYLFKEGVIYKCL